MLSPPKIKNALSITSEIKTDGHSPLQIITVDFEKYLVKSTRGQIPAYYIIN